MESFFEAVDNVSNFLWGGAWNGAQVVPLAPLVILLLGTGIWFMLLTGFRPLRRFLPALKGAWIGRRSQGAEGSLTPWQALSTALSGQVGTGNLAGVASAIALGGPGAIFWMWVTAILGMACAFAETSLAVHFRETRDGTLRGGPMFYIKQGLNRGRGGIGGAFGWLAILFCIGTLCSALITGGMVQGNSLVQSVVQSGKDQFGLQIEPMIVGGIVAFLVFLVIIGGIKSIGAVAGRLVPAMAVGYIVLAIVVLVLNIENVPAAFLSIFTHAFGLEQAVGGAAGYGIMQAIRYGVARGLFSNEAGQGSAPMAHATAQAGGPTQQGEIAMVGVFIDTIVICTMTALVILSVEGAFPMQDGTTVPFVWMSDSLSAPAMTNVAYEASVPFGGVFISVALALFTFTTMIGWSYYAETALSYMAGERLTIPLRLVWVVIIFLGATVSQTESLWRFGDIANAAMAVPNLIALLLLTGVVLRLHRDAPK